MWRNGVPESMCGRRRHKDNPNEIYYFFEERLMYPVVIITCGSLATCPAGRVGEDHQDPMPLVVASKPSVQPDGLQPDGSRWSLQ